MRSTHKEFAGSDRSGCFPLAACDRGTYYEVEEKEKGHISFPAGERQVTLNSEKLPLVNQCYLVKCYAWSIGIVSQIKLQSNFQVSVILLVAVSFRLIDLIYE